MAPRTRRRRGRLPRLDHVTDIVFVLVTLAAFVLIALLGKAVEKL